MAKYLYFFFFLCGSTALFAQTELDKIQLRTEAGAIISSGNSTPFLLRANQYGLVPFESQIAYINAKANREYDSLYTINGKLQKFSFGYGFEMNGILGNVNQILLPQAYVKARFKAFEFYAGRRKQIQGLVDTTGTMGSYIWSGNALPLPKIEISIPNFTPILGHGLISVKGNFAHGWFGSTDSVKNYYLHQKSLYLRVGKPDWRFKFYAGMNHQVQWGGKPATPFYDEISKQTISTYGNDLATYINVVTGVSMAKGGKSWANQPGVPANEAGNRSGNHLGTVDIGFEYDTDNYRLLLYRQSVYDDGSLYYLSNINDGLNGISINRKKTGIKNITLEYLSTTSQGGSIFSNNAHQLMGVDNYFNNSLYQDGWTYKGNTMGSPLMVPFRDYAQFNNVSKFGKVNANSILINRVHAFNFSTRYVYNNIKLKSQLLYTNFVGKYGFTINKNQLSFLQTADFKWRKLNVLAKLAVDNGKFWKNNIGLQIGVRKDWR